MSNSSKIEKIRKLFGGKVEVQEEIDPDQPQLVPNRREKRLHYGQHGHKAGTGKVHDILRLGSRPGRAKGKTGQPNWFRVMKYEDARRKALLKVDILRLESAVGSIAADLHAAGFKNVWDVTQVEDVKTFLLHGKSGDQGHGIRVNDLKKLRDYLIKQRVPVKWDA